MPYRPDLLTDLDLTIAIVRDVVVISPDTTIRSVMDCLYAAERGDQLPLKPDERNNQHPLDPGVRCIVVIEADRVIGILTERDILRLVAQQRSLETVIAHEVMTAPAITLREADFADSFTIINQLQQYSPLPIPVLDEQDRLVGVVTCESFHNALNHLRKR